MAKERSLVARGLIDTGHEVFPSIDVDTGKPTGARADSVTWNVFRKKWILLSKNSGTTTIFYSEADQPTGPWLKAKAIITHTPYRLYNVLQHPFFDSSDERIIYLEGTFTAKRSSAKIKVPDYDYNQLMYRLDLSDPRLEAARIK